jgi:hypothetical protein
LLLYLLEEQKILLTGTPTFPFPCGSKAGHQIRVSPLWQRTISPLQIMVS